MFGWGFGVFGDGKGDVGALYEGNFWNDVKKNSSQTKKHFNLNIDI